MFALAVKDPFERALQSGGQNNLSYIDDTNYTGTPEELLIVFERIKLELKPIGLKVNDTKTSLTYFHHLEPATEQKWLHLGVSINRDFCKLLGAIVAKDEPTAKTALMDQKHPWNAKRLHLYRRLPLLSIQNQMLVLQMLNSSTILHILTCMPPKFTIDLASTHYTAAIDYITQATGLCMPLSERVKQQIMLPLKIGGLGVLSAISSCAPAYIAASFTTITHAPVHNIRFPHLLCYIFR